MHTTIGGVFATEIYAIEDGFVAIEQAFAKFTWLLKSAAQRTVETLWKTCGALLENFTETECRNYIRHCGYRYT